VSRRGILSKIVVLLLVLTMLLGTVSSALARSPRAEQALAKVLEHRQKVLEKLQAKLGFDDLDEAPWATKYLARLHLKGIFQGRGKGKMDPQGKVTRAEVLTLAIRVMGLDAEAQARMKEAYEFPFSDVAEINRLKWARGYIISALEEGLIDPGEALGPRDPASRLWVARVLVRAMGLEEEAQAHMEAALPFADAASIPEWGVGYVWVAADRELVTGYEDGTFRPWRTVTRAEMAALLDRLGERTEAPDHEEALEGTLLAVDTAAMTLTVLPEDSEEPVTVQLATDVLIFVEDEAAELSDLQPGDEVEVFFNEDGLASYVFGDYEEVKVEGTVSEVTADSLIIETADGARNWSGIAGDSLVKYKGDEYTFADGVLKVGDEVKVKLHGDTVLEIVIKERPEVEFTGTVTSIELLDEEYVIVLAVDEVEGDLELQDGEYSLQLAADFVIKYQGEDAAPDIIAVGDILEVKLEGDEVVKVVLDERAEAAEVEFKAVIEGIEAVDGTLLSVVLRPLEEVDGLEVDSSGYVSLPVAQEVADGIDAAALSSGVTVEVEVKDGVVVKLEVEEEQQQEEQGAGE